MSPVHHQVPALLLVSWPGERMRLLTDTTPKPLQVQGPAAAAVAPGGAAGCGWRAVINTHGWGADQ